MIFLVDLCFIFDLKKHFYFFNNINYDMLVFCLLCLLLLFFVLLIFAIMVDNIVTFYREATKKQ